MMNRVRYHLPRLLLAAPASGSGKTMLTCGVLQILKKRMKTAAFKCGPDYIDPMFHTKVLGIPSRNLDTWMASPQTVRCLLAENAAAGSAQIAVIEGVMGYYDGLGGISTRASSYELAGITQTPVILVVDMSGTSLSALALIKGFLEYGSEGKRDGGSGIRGVILNQCSKAVFERLAPLIEEQLHTRALGYVSRTTSIAFPGRHLGLTLPGEIRDLQAKIESFAAEIETTVDIDGLIRIAGEAPSLSVSASGKAGKSMHTPAVRVAVARDEAFCFYYEDNLKILREEGAELAEFSPLKDKHLPDGIQGIYMGGGYPELHGEELAGNRSMLADIRQAVLEDKLPCLAECGAYMYLHEEMEDVSGNIQKMAGVIPGRAFRTDHLVRFGYCELTSLEDTILGPAGLTLRAHEFHYWDTRGEGKEGAFLAEKPVDAPFRTGSQSRWQCMYNKENLLAGFPHLYFPGNPDTAKAFIRNCKCMSEKTRQESQFMIDKPEKEWVFYEGKRKHKEADSYEIVKE